MTFDDVLSFAVDQDRGRELELASPVTGEPTGIKLWIVGPDSDTARKAQLALADELADVADADGRVTAEQRERARLNCLARHVLRWDINEADQPVPFSHQNVVRLLRVNWVQAQVDSYAADRRNFIWKES